MISPDSARYEVSFYPQVSFMNLSRFNEEKGKVARETSPQKEELLNKAYTIAFA
jgi:hypothetical protein